MIGRREARSREVRLISEHAVQLGGVAKGFVDGQPEMAGVQHQIAWAGLHAIGAQLVESLASDAWTLLDQSGALEVFEPRAAWRQERAASLEPSSLFDHRDGVAAGSARHHLLDRAAFAGEERLLLHCQAE